MYRTMYVGHPIAELLRQHFHVMLVQGAAARTALMAPGGTVDTVLGTGLAGSWEIVKRARAAWTFAGAALEADLAHRNMASAPIDYPYRDDARDIWGAIQRFVAGYVARFYAGDAQVHADAELQSWLVEMAMPDRGNLGALPQVQTRDALTALVTQIIFTCSAQHSAVNFPQYDYFGRVTDMPGAIWHDPMSAFATPGMAPPLGPFLPVKTNAVAQIDLVYALSDYRYDRLGDYREHATGVAGYAWLHLVSRELAAKFADDLARVGAAMRDRNGRRPANLRYDYLAPERILNSISI
jgi:arachidonate 15-lipoxygenase